MEKIFPSKSGILEVKITGKELFSEINSSLPSQSVMDYLLYISTHAERRAEINIVIDDEVYLEETRKKTLFVSRT